MNKQAPSLPRILTMVIFALSCFGLLLFLWLSFGGPIPLKPKGYRFEVAFPEAPTLAVEADVRTAGVSVGKVVEKDLDKLHNRTLVSIELDSRFAPLRSDAKAILRQKTLLGETYVELTPGASSNKIKEGGRLPDGAVEPTTELDEIFDAFDPATRKGFQAWQQEIAKGIRNRGRDFNDALGTLPGFAHDGADVLTVLDSQSGALRRLVKNTGVVFGAISQNEDQLHNLITGSGRLFDATSSQQDNLAEAIRIFPTFLDESKATMARLKKFSLNTDPLIRDLQPVAKDLGPTLRDTRALAPDLKQFFIKLDPLITASKTGLPATTEILTQAKPLLGSLGDFLAQAVPIFQYLETNQFQVAEFIDNGAAAIADTTQTEDPNGVGHYLRQIGPTGSESAAVYTQRPANERGNSYLPPLALTGEKGTNFRIFPNFDCTNAGGETKPVQPTSPLDQNAKPGCWEADHYVLKGKLQGRFPHLEADNFDAPAK